MNKPKFKPGDKVVVLDGSKIPDYTGGWYEEGMRPYVGETYTVRCSYIHTDGSVSYHLRGDIGGYVFDERGLASVKERQEVIIC